MCKRWKQPMGFSRSSFQGCRSSFQSILCLGGRGVSEWGSRAPGFIVFLLHSVQLYSVILRAHTLSLQPIHPKAQNPKSLNPSRPTRTQKRTRTLSRKCHPMHKSRSHPQQQPGWRELRPFRHLPPQSPQGLRSGLRQQASAYHFCIVSILGFMSLGVRG